MDDEDYYLRTFEDLLYDSVYLLYFAHDTNQDEYKDDVLSSFVRSSIVNSLLLLECGANCCIDALDLSNKYYNDIEKLPFISKFEYFLDHVNSDKKLNRGCKEIQAINDLKNIRDSYVHPKVRKAKYEQIKENIWDTDFGKTNFIGFPRNPRKWKNAHAILALKTVNDFYNNYFIELCEFSADTTVDLLLNSHKVDIECSSGAAIDCVGSLDRAVTEWDIDFKFIGKTV